MAASFDLKAVVNMAAAVEAERNELREEKNAAYHERNQLVAALAHLYPSGVRRTDIPGWDEHWHGCVYIDLPTGQISYHYHDAEVWLFNDLPSYEKPWDSHDKEAVHKRLQALGR